MDELIQSIYDDPKSWNVSDCTFSKGRFHIIMTGPAFMLTSHTVGVHMTYKQKRALKKAFKWWCKNAPDSKVTGGII